MKKRFIFTALVAILTFAMIGCDDGGGGGGGGGLPKQAEDVVRFIFQNGTYEDVSFAAGDTEWSELKRNDTTFTGFTKIFAGWKDAGRDETFIGTSRDSDKIQDPLTLTAIWYDNTISGADALEKTWLGNTQYPVYKFDVTGKDLTKITGIKATFKVSQATIELAALRPLRAMGPYRYSSTPITKSNDLFFGDFAIDANGAYAAKFDADGNHTIETFNKFHPYLLSNESPNFTNLAGWAKGTAGTKPTPNTWFDVTIATTGYQWNGVANSISRTLQLIADAENRDANGDVQGTELLNGDTDFDTVYFGIGLANTENADDAGKGANADLWKHGIAALVKDVKLIYEDNGVTTEIPGTKPSFPAYTVTWGKGQSPAVANSVVAKPNQTTDQVFAAYIYAVQYNWRGAVGATITPPVDPTYEPPPVTTVVDATADFTVDLTALTGLINTTAFDTDNKVLGPWEITFPMQAGEQLDARSYKHITIKAIAYEDDWDGTSGTTITDVGSQYGPGYGIGYVKFLYINDASGSPVGWSEIATQYNLSVTSDQTTFVGQTVNMTLPTALQSYDAARGLKIAIQNGKFATDHATNPDEPVAFIKLLEITFHYQ